MSDTSGVNLEGDMPGIGTAPPTTGIARSPLQLPSALQGLAKHFQGSQAPQRPKLPLKPPPLTEAQANQPPEHPGTPASFAPVPATVSTPTGGFTPYLKTSDAREPSQWGDPVRFQRLPATFEVAPMMGQIGQYFAQAGGAVGDAANQLSYHSKEYWDGWMRGQDFKMKQAKEGLALSSAQLEESLYRRSFMYKDTLNEYMAAAGGDRHKLATLTLGGMNLYDALHAEAMQLGDTNAVQMFERGEPLEHIINYWQEHDKVYRDLQAARQKASDQEAQDAAYGIKPESQDDAYSKALGDQPKPPGQTQPDQTPSSADYPDALPKGLDPKMVALSQDRFRGVPRDPAEGKDVGFNADKHEKELEVAANKILADAHAGKIKPSEVMPAVRKALGSRIADDAEGVAAYKQPGFGSGAGSGGYGRQADYPRLLDDIAAAADPPDPDHGHGGFVATHYKSREDFRNDNGQFQKVLVRTGDMASTLRNVHDDLDRLQAEAKAQGYGPNDINLDAMLNSLTGQGVANRVRSDLEAYSAAYDFVVSNGHSTISGREAFDKYFSLYMPISTLRDTLKGHVPSTEGILQGIHTHWEGIGGKKNDMPGIEAITEKEIHDYGKMDTVTGALPYSPDRENDIFLKKAGPWGPAGKYYWTGESQTRNDPSNWKRVE